ncbi:glycoside hydrolase family 88 protein [Streptomyces sp. 6N223]|uniref:glycoside hydrolase family 88 protein n=1 Tax=Streptomyces sp. 6N223 TaxID=3457412 RepID=UPI003FD4756C
MINGQGLDTSQAARSTPPPPPADPADLAPAVLAATAGRIAARTEAMELENWFWGEGVALQGLLRLATATSSPPPPFVTAFIDRHLRAGLEVGHVNNLAPGAACADLYGLTGEPRYADGCARLHAWLRREGSVTRDPRGAIEHWPGGVWADTAYMAGVFLIRYGVRTGRPDLVTEAGEQLLAHAEILQHPDTGLYAHGSHAGRTIWCFWGRANAWSALAAVEYLEATPDGPTAARVRHTLRRQLLALADHQPAHGVWDVLVDGQPENRGIPETSAAAGIAAAMFRAAALGIAPDRLRPAAWRALAGIHPYVAPDGTLTRTSAGTILQLVPFGYSVIRDDLIQPWGQGLALQAYAAALGSSVPHRAQ